MDDKRLYVKKTGGIYFLKSKLVRLPNQQYYSYDKES